MPTKQAKGDADNSKRQSSNPLRTLRRAFVTLLTFLLILFIVGLIIGRTDGFRSIVSQRLEKIVGMPVKIDRTALSLNYSLTLREVATLGEQRMGAPGVSARQVDIAWRWSDLWRRGRLGIARLEIEKPSVVFAEDADGAWAPARLVPAGEFLLRQLNVTLPATKTEEDFEQAVADKASRSPKKSALVASVLGLDAAVAVRRGAVTWWAHGGGAPLASIEGGSLFVTPLRAPDRRMIHYLLKVDRAASANGPGMSGVVAELLDIGDQQLVLRLFAEHTMNAPSERSQP